MFLYIFYYFPPKLIMFQSATTFLELTKPREQRKKPCSKLDYSLSTENKIRTNSRQSLNHGSQLWVGK